MINLKEITLIGYYSFDYYSFTIELVIKFIQILIQLIFSSAGFL